MPAPNRKLDAAALEELERLFELEHERTYGHAFRGTYAMETVTLRVTGSVTPEGVQTSVRTKRAISRRAAARSISAPSMANTIRRSWRAARSTTSCAPDR